MNQVLNAIHLYFVIENYPRSIHIKKICHHSFQQFNTYFYRHFNIKLFINK